MKVKDDETLEVLAKNVRELRNGRSYGEIARAAGTYPSSVKRIEDGQHMPGAGLLTRLADALGVTIGDLLSPTKQAEKKSSRSA